MPAYKESDGKHWFCKFYYTDYDGKRRQKLKRNFVTKHEALEYEELFLNGNLSIWEDIFLHIYKHYMEDISEKMKPSTIFNKKNIFENHILPFFARKRMKEITPKLIREWQETLKNDPREFSETYLNIINRQLNALMNHATRYYGLPNNPCKMVETMGTESSGEIDYWTPDEYKVFRKEVKCEPPAFICFETLYWTGIRAGELLALTESDINFDKNELSINKTYQRFADGEYLSTPKTVNSVRRITMPTFLTEEISEYISEVYVRDHLNRIFPYDESWLCYRIHKYAKIAGVHEIKVHSLRHSAASLLINEGFDALEVSRRLGHKRVSTTLDTYSHIFPTKQNALAERLDEIGRGC